MYVVLKYIYIAVSYVHLLVNAHDSRYGYVHNHNKYIHVYYIGASDPYVEVVLMPEDKIKIKAVKTKTIKANVNPYYGKEFTV